MTVGFCPLSHRKFLENAFRHCSILGKILAMKFAGLFFICLLPIFSAQAAENSAFLEAVKAYQNKDYAKAQESFAPLVTDNPENPILLYNLGLSEYQLGHFGKALGLWRKARSIDPQFKPTQQAIEFTEEQLFPEQKSSNFIVILFNTLKGLPLWAWALLSLLTFLLSSYWSLEYGVNRKVGLSHWPIWLYFMFPLFLLSSSMAVVSYREASQLMATVISQNQKTKILPNAESPSLFELTEGQVVAVERWQGAWAQIRTSNGAPGWVPSEALISYKGAQ